MAPKRSYKLDTANFLKLEGHYQKERYSSDVKSNLSLEVMEDSRQFSSAVILPTKMYSPSKF